MIGEDLSVSLVGAVTGPFNSGGVTAMTSLHTPALVRTTAGEMFMLTVGKDGRLGAWHYPANGAADLSSAWDMSASRDHLVGGDVLGPHPFQTGDNDNWPLASGRPSLALLPYLDASGGELEVPFTREYTFAVAPSSRGYAMFTRSEGRIETESGNTADHRWGRPYVMDGFWRDTSSGPNTAWTYPAIAAFTNTERDPTLPPGRHGHVVVRRSDNRLVHVRMGDGVFSFGRNKTGACGIGQQCFEDYPDLQVMSTWLCRQVRRFARETIRCAKDSQTEDCRELVASAPTGVCRAGGSNQSGQVVEPPPMVFEHTDPPGLLP